MAGGNGDIVGAIEKMGKKLGEKIDGLREDLTTRLDKIVENTGAHWRDHEKRLKAIESKLRLRPPH